MSLAGNYSSEALALVLSVVLSCFAGLSVADETATTESGKRVVLRSDGTWIPEAISQTTTSLNEPKWAEDAIDVWDVTLTHHPEDAHNNRYSNEVHLALHYRNKCSVPIIGVVTFVVIRSPLGKIALEESFEDEALVPPGSQERSTTYWRFKDNQFIGTEVYDRLWLIARNGTARIETRVRKVVLQNGMVLQPKPISTRRSVRK